MSATDKKVVKYLSAGIPIRVGEGAIVLPIDHPNRDMVSNTCAAITSKVVSHNVETGEFETLNTVYINVGTK